jgi:hypothetical protein
LYNASKPTYCFIATLLQKHVWRSNIILLTADGYGTTEIMCRAGIAKTAVCRWQERLMRGGRRSNFENNCLRFTGWHIEP